MFGVHYIEWFHYSALHRTIYSYSCLPFRLIFLAFPIRLTFHAISWFCSSIQITRFIFTTYWVIILDKLQAVTVLKKICLDITNTEAKEKKSFKKEERKTKELKNLIMDRPTKGKLTVFPSRVSPIGSPTIFCFKEICISFCNNSPNYKEEKYKKLIYWLQKNKEWCLLDSHKNSQGLGITKRHYNTEEITRNQTSKRRQQE